MDRAAVWLMRLVLVAAVASPALGESPARRFDIPAQPLATALLEFSRQSDVLILVSPALTNGKTSAALNAVLPIDEAIGRLLRGTHLQAISNPKGGYRVERIGMGRFRAAARPHGTINATGGSA